MADSLGLTSIESKPVFEPESPKSAPVELYPFQALSVTFMRALEGALLADEAGLGKTAQSIRAAYDQTPVLIVCPNSLKYWWASEIKRWTLGSSPKVTIVDVSCRHNPDFWDKPAGFYIIHWEALRFDIARIRKVHWGCVIADEAQRMKNRKSQQSKAVRSIRAERRYALTASPVINQPADLWAILNFLYPRRYTGYWKWFNEYVLAIPQPFGGYEIVGIRNPEKLHAELKQFTIRRLKENVLKDLRPKTHTTIPVELSPAQRKAYEQLKKDFVAVLPEGQVIVTPTVLAQLVRLRQVACGLHLIGGPEESTKLDAAEEIILDRNGAPTVVFSGFLGMVHGLARRLQERGLKVGVLVGETALKERDQIVQGFQDGDIQVIIATPQTGGVGLTLTRTDTALFLDQSWSPAVQAQAEDRLHRIGQRSAVQIITLEARDTVEQRIRLLLAKKERLAGLVFPKDEFTRLL
jgi:SNF2 family DNA or RNA helicase